MSPDTPQPGNDLAGPVVARGTFDGTESVSRAVVETLDALPDFDATDGAALYDYVDPDALDDLFDAPEDDAADGTVTFQVLDYQVVVEAGDGVVVRELPQSPADAE